MTPVDLDADGDRARGRRLAAHRAAFRVTSSALRAAWALAGLAVLAACGGGGGDAPSGSSTVAAAPRSSSSAALARTASFPPSADNVGTASARRSAAMPAAPSSAPVLTLPIEVLGDGSPKTPVVAEVQLGVASDKLAKVVTLGFTCHRCGYFGAPEFEALKATPPKVKASVRVLGGVAVGAEGGIPWVDITDATVTLPDVERLQGGVDGGGYYTTHVTLKLPSTTLARLVALPATNRVQFRFNGTEGETSGFRVLALQLQNSAGKSVDSETVRQFDPTTERDPAAYTAADAAAGNTLWHAGNTLAKSSIVARRLVAGCSSCHAENGRDLQYFNYSNNAIEQRARFHGLSDKQAHQIVAYLRSSLKDVPYVAQAAPWNPPYQPGPGLDCDTPDCATRWSAGAGLDAVLGTTADAVKALYGKAPAKLAQADIDKVMDPRKTFNVRETRVPLQFPDWNAWLPAIHPADVWPVGWSSTGSFEKGATFSDGFLDPNGLYKGLVTWLTTNANPNGKLADWSHLKPDQRAQIMQMFTNAGWNSYNFIGGGRGNHIAPNGGIYGAQTGAAYLQTLADPATVAAGKPGAFTTNAFIERAVISMLHWNAVKQWQIAHDFQLEGNQQWFIGSKDPASGAWLGRGEAHGWPYNSVSAFFLAPHMTYEQDVNAAGQVTREWVDAWETDNVVGSYYRSNQWYQLQMTINPGAQSAVSNYPMDWAYLTAFDNYLGMKVGADTPAAAEVSHTHYVRLMEAHLKEAQYVATDVPVHDGSVPFSSDPGANSRARFITQVHPTQTMDYDIYVQSGGFHQHITSYNTFLDTLAPGLQLKVLNGTIAMNNLLYLGVAPTAWRRCDPNNTQLGQPEPWAGFRWCVDQKRVPLGRNPDGTPFLNFTTWGATTSEWEQYGVWRATQMGAEPVRLKAWSDWVDGIWPQ